jgi:molecular chaperone DnaK
MKEYGDQLSADEKTAVEAALKEAEEVVKTDDKDAIDAKAEALATAAQKLGEKMYAAEQAKAQAGEAGAASGEEAKKDEGDVVDAEFTEVKDEKK